MRNRKALEGRCGSCEFNATCGGCRARAYGHTGQLMAEDPWCVYEPGEFGGQPISFNRGNYYGLDTSSKDVALTWTEEAEARLNQIPAFVRGMVAKRVEGYARERGCDRVTLGNNE